MFPPRMILDPKLGQPGASKDGNEEALLDTFQST